MRGKCPKCGSKDVLPVFFNFWFDTKKLKMMASGKAIGYEGYPPFQAYPTHYCKKCGTYSEFRGHRDVRLPKREQKELIRKPFTIVKSKTVARGDKLVTQKTLGRKRLSQLLAWSEDADSSEETWRGMWMDCPKCGGSKCVVPIVYGYPAPTLSILANRGFAILGGCELGDMSGHCRKCGRSITNKEMDK